MTSTNCLCLSITVLVRLISRSKEEFWQTKKLTYRELQFFRVRLKQIVLYEIKKGQSWDMRINSTNPEI